MRLQKSEVQHTDASGGRYEVAIVVRCDGADEARALRDAIELVVDEHKNGISQSMFDCVAMTFVSGPRTPGRFRTAVMLQQDGLSTPVEYEVHYEAGAAIAKLGFHRARITCLGKDLFYVDNEKCIGPLFEDAVRHAGILLAKRAEYDGRVTL